MRTRRAYGRSARPSTQPSSLAVRRRFLYTILTARYVVHPLLRVVLWCAWLTRVLAVQYQLVVKVPFPGVGNNVKLEVPVNITSGIDQPLPRDQTDGESDDPPPILDLPPCVSLYY